MNEEFNTNNVPPIQPTPQPVSYSPEPVKNGNSKRKTIILVSLLILALLAAGVFAYLWQVQSKEATTQRAAVENARTETNTAQAKLGEAVKEKASTPIETTKTPSDDDLIIASAKAYLHAQNGYEVGSGDPNISVSKKSLPFASVNFSSEHGGYACVLKKADGIWLIAFCLNGEPTQDQYTQWGNFEAVL